MNPTSKAVPIETPEIENRRAKPEHHEMRDSRGFLSAVDTDQLFPKKQEPNGMPACHPWFYSVCDPSAPGLQLKG